MEENKYLVDPNEEPIFEKVCAEGYWWGSILNDHYREENRWNPRPCRRIGALRVAALRDKRVSDTLPSHQVLMRLIVMPKYWLLPRRKIRVWAMRVSIPQDESAEFPMLTSCSQTSFPSQEDLHQPPLFRWQQVVKPPAQSTISPPKGWEEVSVVTCSQSSIVEHEYRYINDLSSWDRVSNCMSMFVGNTSKPPVHTLKIGNSSAIVGGISVIS